jgi:hypothetical protein
MSAWPRARKWYGPSQERLQPYGDDEPCIHTSLDELFAEHRSADIDDGEAAVVCLLIRDILVYDPAERPSAAEVLQHGWDS